MEHIRMGTFAVNKKRRETDRPEFSYLHTNQARLIPNWIEASGR